MSKWSDYGEKFLELRSQGMSYQKIAGEIAVSVTTLKKGIDTSMTTSMMDNVLHHRAIPLENATIDGCTRSRVAVHIRF